MLMDARKLVPSLLLSNILIFEIDCELIAQSVPSGVEFEKIPRDKGNQNLSIVVMSC